MNNERKLRTAVGSALHDLEKAESLLTDAWAKRPYNNRWRDDPVFVASNLVTRTIKRLKKGRIEQVEKPARPVKW